MQLEHITESHAIKSAKERLNCCGASQKLSQGGEVLGIFKQSLLQGLQSVRRLLGLLLARAAGREGWIPALERRKPTAELYHRPGCKENDPGVRRITEHRAEHKRRLQEAWLYTASDHSQPIWEHGIGQRLPSLLPECSTAWLMRLSTLLRMDEVVKPQSSLQAVSYCHPVFSMGLKA